MFSNVGKVIKGMAQTIFVVLLLLGCVLGITAGVLLSEGGVDDVVAFFICCGIIGVDAFLSYISVIFLYAFGSIVDDLKEIRSKLCGEEDIKEVPKMQLKTEERVVKETEQIPRATQTSNGDFVITPELRKYYESQPDEKLIEICTSDDYEAPVVSLAKKIIKERSRTNVPSRTDAYNKLLAEYGIMEDAQLKEILRHSDNELEVDAAKEILEVRSVLDNDWVCPMCGNENGEGLFCTRCGYKKS